GLSGPATRAGAAVGAAALYAAAHSRHGALRMAGARLGRRHTGARGADRARAARAPRMGESTPRGRTARGAVIDLAVAAAQRNVVAAAGGPWRARSALSESRVGG